MNWLRKTQLGFRALFQNETLDARMDDEMRSHIEMQTIENIDAGMKPEEARFAATRQFGWVESIKETCRDQRGAGWLENLGQDICYGARMLRKNPGFTTVAVATLALGIGANTAIFTLANAILFRAAPFPEPDQIYYLHTRNPLREITGVSGPDLLDWQKQTRVFSGMAAFSAGEFNVRAGESPAVMSGVSFTKDFLNVFGVRPILGRSFSEEEYSQAQSTVVMVGQRFWRRTLNQDPAIVGKVIRLDGENRTVIGVLPQAVASLGDFWESMVSPDVCLPMDLTTPLFQDRSQRSLKVIARLRPGVTSEQAESEAALVGSRLAGEYPAANKGHALLAKRWDHEREGSWKSWLFFMGMVGCVLLIACANVANLLLARAMARGKEIGIRSALGASRWRLVRQLLAESLLLALIGGALGILLSRWSAQALVARLPASFFSADPASVNLVIDWRVLAFVLGAAVASTLLFGLVPALQTSRVDVNRSLQDGNQGTSGGRRQRKTSRGLVIAEVSVSLTLLLTAATMMDAFLFNLGKRTKPGFETTHLAYARLALMGPKYETQEQRINLLNLLTERLRSTSGIEAVTLGSTLPKCWPFSVRPYPTDRPPASPGATVGASCIQTDPGYFKMFNIIARRGRLFTEQDRAGSTPVAIINERLASQLFRTKNPLGQRITLQAGSDPCEVVGIVHYEGDGYPSCVFVPIAQRCWVYPTVVIRTTSDPAPFLGKLREALRTADSDQPLDGISTMDRMLKNDELGIERGMLVLLRSFAGAGFLLAIVGIGSIVAYAASQRNREIGIRLALGATRDQILMLMLREGLVPVVAGLGAGFLVNLAIQRLLWSQGTIAPGWEPNVPLLFALVIGAFSFVAMLASCFPAHRATLVNPIETLRHD